MWSSAAPAYPAYRQAGRGPEAVLVLDFTGGRQRGGLWGTFWSIGKI